MACKRSAVRLRLPPPEKRVCGSPSARGLGHRPFTAITGVRIPVGTPYKAVQPVAGRQAGESRAGQCGVVVQSVRIPACHAGGRGFESRPLRQLLSRAMVRQGVRRSKILQRALPVVIVSGWSWGYSSAGRALAWHARGQRFDPAYLHQ